MISGVEFRCLGLKLVLPPSLAQISNPAPQIANVRADPHANMKPANLNCASQGTSASKGTSARRGSSATSTYSSGGAKRAYAKSSRGRKVMLPTA